MVGVGQSSSSPVDIIRIIVNSLEIWSTDRRNGMGGRARSLESMCSQALRTTVGRERRLITRKCLLLGPASTKWLIYTVVQTNSSLHPRPLRDLFQAVGVGVIGSSLKVGTIFQLLCRRRGKVYTALISQQAGWAVTKGE